MHTHQLRCYRVDKEDEIECLIKGCNFLLRNIPHESFTYHHHEPVRYKFQTVDPCHMFPYLLVNIGSGVSIVKVSPLVMGSQMGWKEWIFVGDRKWNVRTYRGNVVGWWDVLGTGFLVD